MDAAIAATLLEREGGTCEEREAQQPHHIAPDRHGRGGRQVDCDCALNQIRLRVRWRPSATAVAPLPTSPAGAGGAAPAPGNNFAVADVRYRAKLAYWPDEGRECRTADDAV